MAKIFISIAYMSDTAISTSLALVPIMKKSFSIHYSFYTTRVQKKITGMPTLLS